MFPWNFTPFNKDTIKKLQRMKPDEVETYVNEMMGKMFPPEMQGMDFMKGANPLNNQTNTEEEKQMQPNPAIFETHDYVYIRLPIKDENWLKDIKVFHTSNLLIIEHLYEKENSQRLPLPAIVKKKGAKASYKDGILEVKLPKNIDMQYSEIDISEQY